jgi:uncharacterized protein YndB with AHSA1/START domain
MISPTPPYSFQLRYLFAAHREAVFRAWTDAQALKQWFRPAGHRPTAVTIDLRVGGILHMDMETEQGDVYHFSGEFEVVQPPEKLVLSWFCSLHQYANTRLTLEFHDRGESTEVILTHEGFADEATMTDFMNGWPPAIAAFRRFVARSEDH